MSFCKVLITGYAVSFIASLGKSLFGKKEQESNKLTLQLKEKEIELKDQELVELKQEKEDWLKSLHLEEDKIL